MLNRNSVGRPVEDWPSETRKEARDARSQPSPGWLPQGTVCGGNQYGQLNECRVELAGVTGQ